MERLDKSMQTGYTYFWQGRQPYQSGGCALPGPVGARAVLDGDAPRRETQVSFWGIAVFFRPCMRR